MGHLLVMYHHFTAVRNSARYPEDTIRSVISQGYPNLEHIIVDGVSTDGTLDIIRKYEKDNVWWASQPDKVRSPWRNSIA
jgi:glycosyltransferase involved in cell wall biosynthesis